MKVIRIVGLLFMGWAFTGIQAMDFPQQPTLEQRLLNGDISVAQYLLSIEMSNSQYGLMLIRLKVADYSMAQSNFYDDLEAGITRGLVLARMGRKSPEAFRQSVERGIWHTYQELIDAEARGEVREPKDD
jgi:hypothetical protein